MKFGAIAVVTAVIAGALTPAAAATAPLRPFSAETVSIRADDPVLIDGREYVGDLELSVGADGIVLIEEIDPDRYLYGIREVPASWDTEALKVQAVAARTYLAWTLARGRVGAGSTYGFDICATAQCQVYKGSGGTDLDPRWQSAVDSTLSEILIYNNAPAQALYSSTTGGRTRNIEDVWGGGAKPYLIAVDSPDEPSPFVDWSFTVTTRQMNAILRAADLPSGVLSMEVVTTADGEGSWQVVASGRAGVQTWSTWEFRGIMNRYAKEVFPDQFPAMRNEDRRYPQVVLGPTFEIASVREYDATLPGYPKFSDVFVFNGHGWGHLVGMSQYGAQQMASQGSTYDEILNHYYTGLFPQVAGEHLPEVLKVGLSWTAPEFTLWIPEGAAVRIDGESVDDPSGEWVIQWGRGELKAYPPGSVLPTYSGCDSDEYACRWYGAQFGPRN